MREGRHYSLSVEELILAMYVIGRQEAAAGLLQLSFDPMSDQELEIRLLTAGHSLAARGWLTVDEQAGTKELDAGLTAAILPLCEAAYTLRFTKQAQGEEVAMGIHVAADGQLTVHRLEKGFIHRMEVLSGPDEILGAVQSFFELTWQEHSDETFETTVRQELEQTAAQEAEELETLLADSGMPEPLKGWFAEDLTESEDWWTVLRVEYTEEREPQAERGFLLLSGKERFWLLRPIEGDEGTEDDAFAVELGTRESLERDLAALMEG